MFKVVTDYPLAVESDDHKHPEGIYYDNNLNLGFVESLENYFDNKDIKQIYFMDLGCAGGELVCHLHKKGHLTVGLEGSDHCLNIRQEMVEEVGMLPAGHKNWQEFGNKILFTCDVTKKYQVLLNDAPFKFDIITCWDVIEHFNDEDLDTYFNLVNNHLKDSGLFVSSIHMGESKRNTNSKNTPVELNYHKCVHGKDWWNNKLSEHFKLIDFPFTESNRGHPAHHQDLFACVKK